MEKFKLQELQYSNISWIESIPVVTSLSARTTYKVQRSQALHKLLKPWHFSYTFTFCNNKFILLLFPQIYLKFFKYKNS